MHSKQPSNSTTSIYSADKHKVVCKEKYVQNNIQKDVQNNTTCDSSKSK